MDDTSQKIVDAAMALIRDKGYVATTTKEIARLAGVNECTLFRKFENKKDIVLQGGIRQMAGECYTGYFWERNMGFTDRLRNVHALVYG